MFDVSDTTMFKCSCGVQLPIPEINSLKITKLAGAHFLDIFFVSGIVDIGIWKQAPAAHACWLLGLLMTSTTPSGKKCISFNSQYLLMTLKGIKALSENSTKCFGANRIIMAPFQHGFIDLAH